MAIASVSTTLAVWLAAQLGLAAGETEIVRLGAILHDVGKIGIPDRVLLKPGPLTAEELVLMRTHPQVGDRVLEPSRAPVLGAPGRPSPPRALGR